MRRFSACASMRKEGEGASGQFREIGLRQALQAEGRLAGNDRHGAAIRVGREHDFGAVGQLADDVVEEMRRNRRGASLLHHGGRRFIDLKIKIGGLEREACALSLQKHVRQNRYRVAAFHDAVDVIERFEKVRSL